MTLKYKDLEDLMKTLRRIGYTHEIPNIHLEKEIGKKFGISSYTLGNIKKQLVRFGFISGDGVMWIVKYGREETKQEVEKEIEKEISKYDEVIE